MVRLFVGILYFSYKWPDTQKLGILAYLEKGGSYILVSMYTPSNHRSIYSYALDRVFLWCQIARATLTVKYSLNPDLVQATPM